MSNTHVTAQRSNILTLVLAGSLAGCALSDHAARVTQPPEPPTQSGISAAAPVTAADSLNRRGIEQADTGQYAEAASAFRASLARAESQGDSHAAARAVANLARIELLSGDPQQALASIRRGLTHASCLPPNRERAALLLGLGHIGQLPANRARDSAEWHATIEQALQAGTETAEQSAAADLASFGHGYMGQQKLGASQLEEAQAETAKAEFAAQSISRPDILYRWQWQMARILRQQQNLPAAANAYRQALGTLLPIRAEMERQKDLDGGQDQESDLFYEAADVLLRGGGERPENLHEVRAIVETGRAVELENFYRDDCVAALAAKSKAIDQLSAHTAALYPILLPDRLELLLGLPDGIKRYTVSANAAGIPAEVRRLRYLLEKRTTREFLPHAQAVYRYLIQPLEKDLQTAQVDTLIFVPTSEFRLIPLAALHDGREFLARRFAIATSPALQLTDPRPFRRDATQALVAGLSEATQGFPALPHVDDELERVAAQFQSALLRNQEFNRKELEKRLMERPYGIVHIASHGQFGATLDDTFVLTSDGRLDMDGLGRLMGRTRFRDEPVELLTLSACQTAAGDERAALGLAGIALKAGARSALASLWFINDPASSTLIADFYRQIKQPGTSKARALQLAQSALMQDPRYRHPAYWAPFLLIGNWL